MANNIERILFVLNDPSITGGATTGLLQLLRGLPRDRYRAYLVVPRPLTSAENSVIGDYIEDVAVVKPGPWAKPTHLSFTKQVLVTVSHTARTGLGIRPVAQILALLRHWKIDLLYTNSALVADGALAARLADVPHIWHIKEWIGDRANSHFYLPDRYLFAAIDKLSSRIVVMSHFLAESFRAHQAASKLRVIYDGVDPEVFTLDGRNSSLRNSLGVKDDEFLVGMVASMSALWKEHDVFIRMAAILANTVPEARFVHFGPLPSPPAGRRIYDAAWRHYQEILDLVEALMLSERFIWGGVCTDIPQMMASLDILVHPCSTEPFGRVAIEAMAAGRPVIGPDRGGIAESVIDGETGFLVVPGDPEAFAAAAERLLRNPHLRQGMGQRGRLHVQNKFSVALHVEHMSELFDEVL